MSGLWNLRLKPLLARLLIMIPPLWTLIGAIRSTVKRALLDRPREVEGYKTLAQLLVDHGRLTEAMELYRALIKRDRLHAPQHRHSLANLCIRSGHLAEAMKNFDSVLRMVGHSLDTVIQVAHILAVNGYLDEAVEVYKTYVRKRDKKARKSPLTEMGVRVLPYYWVDRIGHIAFLDSYFKMTFLGYYPSAPTILLAPPDKVANHHYLEYWRRYFTDIVADTDRIRALEKLVRIPEDIYFAPYIAPTGNATWWIKAARAAQMQWDSEGRKPLIALSDDVLRRGEANLAQMGVPRDAWFVCLHVRDSGFHSSKPDPSQKWRDSDMNNYVAGIQTIIERGGWVIRMGDPEMKEIYVHERFIHYPSSRFKSDWMDVFLCARCRFFVATNSGLGVLPSTFGVPAICIDYIPLANELYVKDGCFVPKLLWSKSESRFLTFDEMMTAPVGFAHSGDAFKDFEIRDSTSREIEELVTEMLDRLDGTFSYAESDASLQRRFDAIRQKRGIVSRTPIGRDFLRAHANLLGASQ